jgi:predicted GNAT family acetyltransferase
MHPVAIEVTDVPGATRFEARAGGVLAGYLEYVLKRGRLALVHTEVLTEFEGRGVGGALARFALDDARRRELLVIAICPFVRSWLERHPEHADIVVGRPSA